MTITEQLAAALRDLLASCIEAYGQPDDGAADESVGWNSAGYTLPFTYGLMQRARAALAAYDAQPAADGDVVERVARALARKARVSEMNASGFNGIHLNEYVEVCWRDHIDRARAALAAFDAQPAADDDATVERVAARFDHALQVSLVAEALLKGFWFSDEKQAVRAARAALAAMAAPTAATEAKGSGQ